MGYGHIVDSGEGEALYSQAGASAYSVLWDSAAYVGWWCEWGGWYEGRWCMWMAGVGDGWFGQV